MLLKELKTLDLKDVPRYLDGLVMCYNISQREYVLVNFTATEYSNCTGVYMGMSLHRMQKVRQAPFTYLVDTSYMVNPTSLIVLDDLNLTKKEQILVEKTRRAILMKAQKNKRYREMMIIKKPKDERK